jgi:hypothetical protein
MVDINMFLWQGIDIAAAVLPGLEHIFWRGHSIYMRLIELHSLNYLSHHSEYT